ncbi:MAG: fibronectin type III domain-containing protein [Acidobacteriaceae bacterium]
MTDLSASRAGDAVTLRWTTPLRTTDKLPIKGPIVAEICLEAPPVSAATPATGLKAPMAERCAPVVQRKTVAPGESQAVVTLPAALASGPPGLVAYRVQLRNAAGRTAGASSAAYAASGPPPGLIEGLQATATKAGVVLEWRPEAHPSALPGSGAIELDRTMLNAPAPTHATAPPRELGGLAGPAKEPVQVRLRVDAGGDPSATIDRDARMGRTYQYTAERVRTIILGGQKLEVRSLPSASVTVAVQDIFPPEPPMGLVAVPGFADADNGTRKPSIDLSWEPDTEPGVAGYRLYRRELDGTTPDVWRRLGSLLVTVPAYRDLSALAGQKYAYWVTAVSEAGEESTPSGEVMETAPIQ